MNLTFICNNCNEWHQDSKNNLHNVGIQTPSQEPCRWGKKTYASFNLDLTLLENIGRSKTSTLQNRLKMDSFAVFLNSMTKWFHCLACTGRPITKRMLPQTIRFIVRTSNFCCQRLFCWSPHKTITQQQKQNSLRSKRSRRVFCRKENFRFLASAVHFFFVRPKPTLSQTAENSSYARSLMAKAG